MKVSRSFKKSAVRSRSRGPLLWVVPLVLPVAAATGQDGGAATTEPTVEIPWHTIDGGGGRSFAGIFELTGTIAQWDASLELSGGRYSISGGFWAGGRANAGCNPADIEQPFGVLNIDDVLFFLNSFAANDSIADIAEPSGSLDVDDLLLFLDLFAQGCP